MDSLISIKSAFAFFKKTWEYFAMWFNLPRRIANIEKAQKDAGGRVKTCPNCDTRMTVFTTTASKDGGIIWRYQCSKCRRGFLYSFKAD